MGNIVTDDDRGNIIKTVRKHSATVIFIKAKISHCTGSAKNKQTVLIDSKSNIASVSSAIAGIYNNS